MWPANDTENVAHKDKSVTDPAVENVTLQNYRFP